MHRVNAICVITILGLRNENPYHPAEKRVERTLARSFGYSVGTVTKDGKARAEDESANDRSSERSRFGMQLHHSCLDLVGELPNVILVVMILVGHAASLSNSNVNKPAACSTFHLPNRDRYLMFRQESGHQQICIDSQTAERYSFPRQPVFGDSIHR